MLRAHPRKAVAVVPRGSLLGPLATSHAADGTGMESVPGPPPVARHQHTCSSHHQTAIRPPSHPAGCPESERRIDKVHATPWRVLILALALGATVAACGDDNPVTPTNRSPVISSLIAFPHAISPTDSTIVICNASDPDGDTLVYDWITDARLRIKGLRDSEHSLYNSSSNSQVFYQSSTTTSDTAWVQCFARDGRGKSDARVVLIPLYQ